MKSSASALLKASGADIKTFAPSSLTSPNMTELHYDSLSQAFPTIDPGIKPLGSRVLVQIKQIARFTKGGIELPAEAIKTEQYNTQVARVVALGPLAFKTIFKSADDQTEVIKDWPDGAWYGVGDFIRVPLYGGDRFTVPFRNSRKEIDHVIFALYKPTDALGIITADPLSIKAHLD